MLPNIDSEVKVSSGSVAMLSEVKMVVQTKAVNIKFLMKIIQAIHHPVSRMWIRALFRMPASKRLLKMRKSVFLTMIVVALRFSAKSIVADVC